ncbi:WD-40 repeat-containing protein MSI2 [Eucalyptus grandis]|uniref:WD-40 repeat-containing protein MSI2 n=1 Tax=Eucalyptus grandis TaxID=71139 RepID=UPI00192F08CA|nr:WD-40 repeat-containing protein MSI2 [Eucalyptus grandis]
MAEEEGSAELEQQLEEEFAVWKKNTPILYDLLISHALEWPSLTVHWAPLLPQPSSSAAAAAGDPSLAAHRLVLGTHTSDGAPNFLILADALLPSSESDHCGDDAVLPKVEISQKIRVDGEVNRARFMPQNHNIVGAKTNGCEVYVFDCSKQAAKQHDGGFDPDLRLTGHDGEGYGLSWSPLKENYLLSASHDKKICLWDISAAAQDKVLGAMHVFEAHEGAVGDASWHLKNDNLFGSAGDDCQLMIWDLRTNKAQQCVKAHEKEVNSVSFNSYNDWILATASSDTTVGLFDMRKLTTPLHVFSSHEGEVLQVEWDPNHEAVLASSSEDRRVMVWDLNRIGDEQQEGDASDGPAELLFSHGGHKAKISDFSWNKNEPWVISSVAEDNSVQVWQMAESICGDDDDMQAMEGYI